MSIKHENKCYDSDRKNTLACFLDLPSGCILNVDGVSMSIQRDDFVGISQIPIQSPQSFHFITITPKSSSLTTGFVLLQDGTFIRRYDPRTEEVSSTPLGIDDMTTEHLIQQVPALEAQQRIVPYHVLVSIEQQTKWNQSLTNYISNDLLQRRGICNKLNQKVVPGCIDDVSNHKKHIYHHHHHHQHTNDETDGTSLRYFSVPILDQRRRRWASHVGTQRFLQTLSAQEKTELFVHSYPSQHAWEILFAKEYNSNWEFVLGDVQLSFLFFVHLHCFESLMHWRDLLSLLGQLKHPSRLLIPVLIHQLSNLDASDVLQTSLDEDDDHDDVVENSIASALQRLVQTWQRQPSSSSDEDNSLQYLTQLIQDRLCSKIQSVHDDDDDDDDEEEVDDELQNAMDDLNSSDADDEDDEGPMIVDTNDYEAALQRNQQITRKTSHSVLQYTPEIAQAYPILWAAKQEHEDLVMTCARALEEANDVSLVRQAADYLEQVEAKSASC